MVKEFLKELGVTIKVEKEFVIMTNAAPRSALTYTLTLPGDYAGTTIHCYISFVSVDGKMASKKKHLHCCDDFAVVRRGSLPRNYWGNASF